MDPKNKLGAMPVRPLLYTMAVPLMLSLLIQSLYNIVDSIFVARLSETALTAASLVYAIQFLMIAIGVGTAVGLNALLSRKLGQKKPEEACRHHRPVPDAGQRFGTGRHPGGWLQLRQQAVRPREAGMEGAVAHRHRVCPVQDTLSTVDISVRGKVKNIGTQWRS